MKILVHDYAGHPFQVELSRELAAGGHEVVHAFAGGLQTPRGELTKGPGDPVGFEPREVAMDPDYANYKYSFRRRRAMEIAYGREAARLVREIGPDLVLSSNTPTESQASIVTACRSGGCRFVFWCQDFYSIAVDKLVRKKIPVLGGLVGAYYKFLERRQLAASDHVVAITEDFKPIMVAVPEVNLAARIIASEEAGLTVPPADESAYLAAAEEIFRDPARAGRMAANARAYAERSFDVKGIAAKFNAIFSALVDECTSGCDDAPGTGDAADRSIDDPQQ